MYYYSSICKYLYVNLYVNKYTQLGVHVKKSMIELTTQLFSSRAEFISLIRVPYMDLNCITGGSGDCIFRLSRWFLCILTLESPDLNFGIHFLGQGFSRCGPKALAFASSGNLLEMQMIRPHPRHTELNPLRSRPVICGLTSPPGDSDAW